ASWPAMQQIEGRLSDFLQETRTLGPLTRSLGGEVEQQAQEIRRRCREVEKELRTFVDTVRAMPPDERRQSEIAQAVDRVQSIREQLITDLSARRDYEELVGRFRETWAHFIKLRTVLAVQVRYRPALKHLDRLNLNEVQEKLVTVNRPGHYRI